MFGLASLVIQCFGSHHAESFTLACYPLVQGWDSDTIAEDASVWDTLGVVALDDCSSDIKPKGVVGIGGGQTFLMGVSTYCKAFATCIFLPGGWLLSFSVLRSSVSRRLLR